MKLRVIGDNFSSRNVCQVKKNEIENDVIKLISRRGSHEMKRAVIMESPTIGNNRD
jgi:hypothetical protein